MNMKNLKLSMWAVLMGAVIFGGVGCNRYEEEKAKKLAADQKAAAEAEQKKMEAEKKASEGDTKSDEATKHGAGEGDDAVGKAKAEKAELKKIELGGIRNVSQVGKCYLAGAPTEKDFALLKERGVTAVINLRRASELSYDEKAAVEGAGLKYVHLPVGGAGDLTDELFDTARAVFKDHEDRVFVHCAGAVRVAPVWIVKRVLDDGVSYEEAVKEARVVGREVGSFEAAAKAYIEKQQK